MNLFHKALLDRHADLLEPLQPHPLMSQIAEGTFSAERFHHWLCQDYLGVRAFERFLIHLSTRARSKYQRPILEAALNVSGDIEAFEHMAKERNLDLSANQLGFAHHAFTQFLLATVHARTFEESLCVCYASDHAYLESWCRANAAKARPGPWQGFIDQRTSDDFHRWVERLARYVDEVAQDAAQNRLEAMAEAFRMTLYHQTYCWDAALKGEGW
jgi:thiaminase